MVGDAAPALGREFNPEMSSEFSRLSARAGWPLLLKVAHHEVGKQLATPENDIAVSQPGPGDTETTKLAGAEYRSARP